MEDYDAKAKEFLDKTGTKFEAEFCEHNTYFSDDKEMRDIYWITLTRGDRTYKFRFGQSISNSGFHLIRKSDGKEQRYSWQKELDAKCKTEEEFSAEAAFMLGSNDFGFKKAKPRGFVVKGRVPPSPYDVLAALTKYDPGTFEEFCSSYGYDDDSRKAEGIYKSVLTEWRNMQILFSDVEIDALCEIN